MVVKTVWFKVISGCKFELYWST